MPLTTFARLFFARADPFAFLLFTERDRLTILGVSRIAQGSSHGLGAIRRIMAKRVRGNHPEVTRRIDFAVINPRAEKPENGPTSLDRRREPPRGEKRARLVNQQQG